MKLEDQVCSLELAKKLKELGVKRESLFYWTDGMRYDGGYDMVYKHAPTVKEGGGKITNHPAYTVSELGELLPTFIEKAPEDYTEKEKYFFTCEKSVNGWSAVYAYYLHGEVMDLFYSTATTEANARAKCLIRLMEDKLI